MSLTLTQCPECGAPAEVQDEGCVQGTSGPVGVCRVVCVRRHWFLLAVDSLPALQAGGSAEARREPGPR
jgi:hypothetical protein